MSLVVCIRRKSNVKLLWAAVHNLAFKCGPALEEREVLNMTSFGSRGEIWGGTDQQV